MIKIKDIVGRQILDSRGLPTVEAELFLDNGYSVIASVPSGASTGEGEALELRDNDPQKHHGKGVLKAVNNINTVIKDKLVGLELNQVLIDQILLSLDKTPNKKVLGANAVLAVSLATLKALALINNKELYAFVASDKVNLPIPMINIINGGKHANNNLDIQEFMIVPVLKGFSNRLRAGSEIFHSLKEILSTEGLSTNVGDEGGFAPVLYNNKAALSFLVEAIEKAGYIPGQDVYLAIDVAASSFYDTTNDTYLFGKKQITKEQLKSFYLDIIDKYPIISIEDPFYEKDFTSLTELTKLIGDRVMIVGDDYFVTNKQLLQKGISEKAGNAILIKANQVGTITETLQTINLAKKNGYNIIISHRSGETEDTFIADLAVGLNIPFIKTGSVCRGERIAKYNRLLRIEETLIKVAKR